MTNSYIDDVSNRGALRANEVADEVMARVRAAVGLTRKEVDRPLRGRCSDECVQSATLLKSCDGPRSPPKFRVFLQRLRRTLISFRLKNRRV